MLSGSVKLRVGRESVPVFAAPFADWIGRNLLLEIDMAKKLQERLKATLTQLHEELESLDEADAETRQMLARAAEDLRVALADGHTDTLAGGSYASGLRAAIGQFEKSNPALFKVVMNLVNTLGEMGV